MSKVILFTITDNQW